MNNKLKNNKKQNFESITLVHLDSLYNLSLSLTGDSDDSKELVHETYCKAYKFFHQAQEGTCSRVWLFKIFKNTFINLYGKKETESKIIKNKNIEHFINSIQKNNNISYIEEANLLNKLSRENVTSSLNQLPDDFKMVVILTDLEEFSYRETAYIMDCPLETVRLKLSTGRRMLHKILLDYAFKKME